MIAYWILAEVKHRVKGYACLCATEKAFNIDASSLEFAKKKIARRYNTAPKNVKILDSKVIGYY